MTVTNNRGIKYGGKPWLIRKSIGYNYYYTLHLEMKSMFTQMSNAYELALQYLSTFFFLEIQELVILDKECGVTVNDQFSTVK